MPTHRLQLASRCYNGVLTTLGTIAWPAGVKIILPIEHLFRVDILGSNMLDLKTNRCYGPIECVRALLTCACPPQGSHPC